MSAVRSPTLRFCRLRRARAATVLACLLLGTGAAAAPPLPPRLSMTGLYSDIASRTLAADVLTWTPQYPLWSDHATKWRAFALPAGTRIDAGDPDAWQFPPGTRAWKTFSHGEAVETRYIERLADGRWRFASYAWDADRSDARLVDERGAVLSVAAAPGGRYVVPSRSDCLACHGDARSPLLGLAALQLSPDRDGGAPRAETPGSDDVDLPGLIARGLLVGWPERVQATPPRIAARSANERAALGYLHGNCGHCHHRADGAGGAPVELILTQSVLAPDDSAMTTLRTLLQAAPRYRPRGSGEAARLLVPGDAAASLLHTRVASRSPALQMPPLGSRQRDEAAVALIERWIDELPSLQETPRWTPY